MRRMSNHFRTGLDAMIREAEMEEAEKEWRERNRQIMARSGDETFGSDPAEPAMEPLPGPAQEPAANEADARAEAAIERAKPKASGEAAGEPELPLDPPPPPENGEAGR